jgi:cleavage and polyadenylation specificity factor subunit 2
VVYAVNLNHTKERHLDGTVLLKGGAGGGVLESLSRPDLLITDAERTLMVSARRKDRDAALLGKYLYE